MLRMEAELDFGAFVNATWTTSSKSGMSEANERVPGTALDLEFAYGAVELVITCTNNKAATCASQLLV
jgi:hypothetical protein